GGAVPMTPSRSGISAGTADLLARRRAVVARGVGSFAGDIAIASGRGAVLVDADGQEWIDLASGIGVMAVGHSHPDVVAAVQAQVATLQHTCIHVATNEPYVALAETLASKVPHGNATRVMLANSGAEAIENAVKIARQATRRPAVIAFDGAFHGRTLLALTLTGKSGYKTNCGPFAPEVYRQRFPDRYRFGAGMTEEQFASRELDDLRDRFVRGPVPAGSVAAIVIEVVQGEGGFVPAPLAYLRGLRDLCDAHGILLIVDEVQTGCGRTGRWAAYEHAGIVPDISVWAKAMGGGLPIAAVVGKAAVMDAAEPGTLGGTYGGNPVACAAALAAIDVIERERLADRAVVIGQRIRDRFDALKRDCPIVGDVRGMGAMLAMELSCDGDPTRPAAAETAAVVARCRQQRVLVLTAGPHGNVIRMLPPLVITDAELERGLDAIEEAIRCPT
ncbi:MAG TPA: aspartate aminotransferase family protein, partial [Vicinamibacterales bacterium]|nr:aspartate aminotransferase family protein [Vicinamibacterales bacterium]